MNGQCEVTQLTIDPEGREQPDDKALLEDLVAAAVNAAAEKARAADEQKIGGDRRDEDPGPRLGRPSGRWIADPIARLVKELAKLPGIGREDRPAARVPHPRGPRTRRRARRGDRGVVRDVRLCSLCQTLTDQDPCAICADPRPRPTGQSASSRACPTSLAIERTHEFRGRYHVLHGALSPLDGVGPPT